MPYCCPECFGDDVLRGIVHANKETDEDCDYCGAVNVPVVGPEVVGAYVERLLTGLYCPTDQLPQAPIIDVWSVQLAS